MPMACRRYCTHGLSCFLLLVSLLFLSCLLRDELVAAVDVPSSLPLDKAQEVIMMNLSSVVGEGWSSSKNFCTWTGVACSRSGSSSSLVVTNITLSNYGISDPSVFSSLCLLDTLLSLDLSRNNLASLGDKFSTTYCRMKEGLLSLNLSSNQLSDKLSDFCGLPQLEVLDLSFNLFTDENLSPDLGSLPKLRSFNLTGNPHLIDHTGNKNHPHKRRVDHVVVVIIFGATAGALVGSCFLLAFATACFPKRTYRAETESGRIPTGEDDSQNTNGWCLVMNCLRASATMTMKEKPQDEWRVTAFQALNFDAADLRRGLTEENLVGSGGSDHVYRVTYSNRHDSSTGVVAVKQIRSAGSPSPDEKLELEFESEACILCNVRHSNIVRLLCCLSGSDCKLLVYDYRDNGSLDRWLHGDYVLRAAHPAAAARPVPLDWPTRLIAAVGAAQGLCYMHHACSPPIIHRDVKSSNILLDSEFRAKVADFGLARMMEQPGEPHTMSWVVGSFGYMAPEYAYTRKVNEKVDVFGFGVVLLELTTGRKANDGGEHGSLAEWAGHHYRSGSIRDATDICIRYAGYTDEIETVFRLGVRCTGSSPLSRPTMKDVLQILLRCSEQTLRKSRLECSMECEAAPFLLP
ncbi:LRR receptor-like serine/threonine-protein kinase HSL2 [Panicum virgatum]|uniref:Protein kinase domain-containing protein n=1 Tax=Panicum virgatum TaxID=38727 RepID=A0A8T0XC82_PANVG|nr:LRR receptor-like serine/threonine-protein kinase HSL2 [Panicum virgatum]KAG2657680.1 hypothetical protein PVAP13_1KG198300 [Panicum virgatum]